MSMGYGRDGQRGNAWRTRLFARVLNIPSTFFASKRNRWDHISKRIHMTHVIPKVTGYLADTWSAQTREALIINPDARPVDLLAWCWGELESLRAAVSTLHAARGELNKDDFSALVFHRIEPMGAVLGLAIERMLVSEPAG
jgi:hypothetical protein